MLKKIIIVWLAVTISILVISCSDDKNPVTPEEQKEVKELGLKEITVPEALAQSNDPHAQICVGFINMANGFKGFSSFYHPPDNANLPKQLSTYDNWTHTWNNGQMTVTMNYFESESDFGWKIYLTGTDGQFTYSNWLMMEAEQKLDDSYGTLIVYKPVTDQVEFQWTWSQSESGQNTFTMEIFGEDGLPDTKIDVVSNSDDSGELTFYQYNNGAYVKESRITWTSAGTGQWWEYDESGNVTAEGSF